MEVFKLINIVWACIEKEGSDNPKSSLHFNNPRILE